MKITRVALAIVFSTSIAAISAAADLRAWAVSDTTRLLRSAPPAAGRRVELAAARNEWESFQVFVRSDGPVKGVNLVAGDLSGPGGSVIGAADAVLYREHQLEITEPSHRNEQFTPGWYPDALIPFLHPLTHRPLRGGKFSAVPFDLPGGETHGFWVDVRVPTEARAGTYRGTYRIADADGGEIGIEVVLTVWDFELPRVASFQTALGSPGERLRRYYALRAKDGKEPEPRDWEAVDAQIADELCRHRINATPPPALVTPVKQGDGSYHFSSEQITALRRFVDTYNINALQVPHPRTAVKDPSSESATLGAWLKSFDVLEGALARPAVTFFTYLKDEPNKEEEYRYVQKWGAAIRAMRSPVKVLVVEQTKSQDERWGTLHGAVDIWCPLFSLHDEETAAQRIAAGETVWTYTALCQRDPTPWWQIDFPLLNYRVPAWIAWRYHMQGLLYWGGMSHWSGVQDPWTDPKTLDRRKDGKGPLYQGEGSLLYPGRQIGYDGVAPSMRLKALRDGIEDFEYLKILERKGLGDAARAIVMPLTPSWFKWNGDPSAYGKARSELAKMISAACLAASARCDAAPAGAPGGLAILFEPRHSGISLPFEVSLPTSALGGRAGGWQLRDQDAAEMIPCQLSHSPTGAVLRFVIAPRTYAQASTRNFRLFAAAESPSPFKIADTGDGSLAVEENGRPVLAYNQAPRLEAGVPDKFRRSCYVHPIYDLDGTVLTDDFPKDHYHHRGLCWAWPHVRLAGEEKSYDVWAVDNSGQRFDRILGMETGAACARFGAAVGWYLNDRRVVHETAWLTVFRSDGFGRFMDFDLTFEAVDVPVTIGGREKKGYGGFTLRFGPREDTALTTSAGELHQDADHDRFHWADLSARLRGAQNASGATVFDNAANCGYPNTWCLRRYGIVSPTYPGEGKHEIRPGEPLHLRYRIWIHRGGADCSKIQAAYSAYSNPPKVRLVTQ